MRMGRSAGRGGSRRCVPVSALGALLAVTAALFLSVAASSTGTSVAPTRLVLSSLSSAAAATSLSTKTLYARNDPWKRYLAPEQACPGGERVDLPTARQAETVACLINFARSRRGLRPLTTVAILSGASALKARAILRCGNFAHNPCGGDWEAAVRSTGYLGLSGRICTSPAAVLGRLVRR